MRIKTIEVLFIDFAKGLEMLQFFYQFLSYYVVKAPSTKNTIQVY
jgi:hypothetical protein